jgi:hypothetical protein
VAPPQRTGDRTRDATTRHAPQFVGLTHGDVTNDAGTSHASMVHPSGWFARAVRRVASTGARRRACGMALLKPFPVTL